MKRVRCVYDKDHMYELQIENTSESDPCSYEVTKAVTNKVQKQILRLQWDSNPSRLRYQVSYEAPCHSLHVMGIN